MEFNMSNKMYDRLKWFCQIIIPAIATFYFALAEIWNWGHVEEVVATLTALDAFLGVILGISTANYNAKNQNS